MSSNDVSESSVSSSHQSSTKPSPKSSSSGGKTLFQIDHSFIGNHQFKYRSRSDLKNTTASLASDQTNQSSTEQFLRTSVYCVRLNRLLKEKPENRSARQTIKQKFKLKRTRDLVHTICALYDNCLPDIGAQSVYDCICSPKSFTICVLKESDNTERPFDASGEDTESLYGSHDNLKTIEDGHDYPESCFSKLFSDPEDSDDDDSDGTNKMDFTYGLKSFIDKCRNSEDKEPLLKDLVAVATIQKTSTFQLPGQDEWVVDLELMSVRPKYRNLNIGKYLINLIQNKNYVGNFDAIVTSSDLDAIKFYEKFGFNIDPILNSKYKFIGDIWTNTTKMCYVPPYCQPVDKNAAKLKEAFSLFAQTPSLKPIESTNQEDMSEVNPHAVEESFDNMCVVELTNMENDFKRWQKLMFSAYQSQAQIFFKLKQEITNLKIKLSAKENMIEDLQFKNDLLTKRNKLLRMERGESLELEADAEETKTETQADETKTNAPDSLQESDKEGGMDLDKLIADLKILSRRKTFSSIDE